MKKKIFFFTIIIFLLGCDEEQERKSIIEAAIKLKVDEYKTKRIEDQKRKELDKAVQIADSILLLNADLWQISMDSLGIRPPRVSKPNVPNISVSIDSAPIKPLFPIKH